MKISKPVVLIGVVLVVSLGLSSHAARANAPATFSQDLRVQPIASQVTQWSGLDLRAFHLVTSDAGWILLQQRLFWTTNRGRNWHEITPPFPTGYEIRDVSFANTVSGWAFLSKVDAVSNSYLFARTQDGGTTWQVSPVSFFQPGDIDDIASAVWIRTLDGKVGWIVFRRATSSNFSIGTLFKTEDAGSTWNRLTIPLGEPVEFTDSSNGWVAGGPSGNRLFRTRDGGRTWQPIQLARNNQAGTVTLKFSSRDVGIASLVSSQGSTSRVEFFVTRDGGDTWQTSSAITLNQDVPSGTHLPLALFDTRNWMLIAPSDQQAWIAANGIAPRALRSPSGNLAGIRELDMPSPTVGWARFSTSECAIRLAPDKHVLQCSNDTQLLLTEDGQTWQSISPPANALSSARDTKSTSTIGSGQGFDKCQVGSIANLQTWWNTSPYNATNLYIGGIARSCKNEILDSAYLQALSQIGWKFIPTWVGPQAACTDYADKMSYDLATAHSQGYSEAIAASVVASEIGLTGPSSSGTVVYYDLEAYPGGTACRAAASSFVDGWTQGLHSKGITAGVYAASVGSYPSDFVSLPNVPDALWVANWVRSGYDSTMTVWGATGLSDTLWLNHSRLRQYAGNVSETWGNVTQYIDPDVLDGPVAEFCGGSTYVPSSGSSRGATQNSIYIPLVSNNSSSAPLPFVVYVPLLGNNMVSPTPVPNMLYLPLMIGHYSYSSSCVQ